MISRVVEKSNAYVQRLRLPTSMPAGYKKTWPPAWVERWQPLTRREFLLWIAVLFAMTLTHKGPERTFWGQDWLYFRPAAGMLMSRNRFLDIKRGLHLQDDSEGGGDGKPIKKVGVLLNMFLERCNGPIYKVGQNLSLDEAMLKFKGTSAFKYTRQAKPTREGLKMWVLCESKTGYVVAAMLDERKGLTLHNMILDLSEATRDQWRCIYMDNLFSSVDTFGALLERKTYACGTCRAGRGLPSRCEKTGDKLRNQGDWVFARGKLPVPQNGGVERGHILGAKWRDTGDCCMLSTQHVGLHSKVLRHIKGKQGRHSVNTLDCYRDYNDFMGGVDLADQKRAMLSTRLRAYKWWHPVLYWMLDTARINSLIVRNDSADKYKIEPLSSREYIEELIVDLRQEALQSHVEDDFEAQQTRLLLAGRKDLERLVGGHLMHFPEKQYVEKLKTCVVCSRDPRVNQSNYKTKEGCPKCGEVMHIECFEAWHTQQHPKSCKA
uniref:PiggyBac transposable element-derived protein domain-containing protein n=2 Tax=Hemiselmis andersenii TaxID=464988 RepID=A0A7S1ENT7_HEMAN|mmetsp:Transcript_54354/g.131539  ORF Transcript_54354/g.131539 Transcript_54354/m.131539 type:complete len:492 (+) Transcript_54354:271-1746(+)